MSALPQSLAQHVDLLIVGAGLSGIGLACYMKKEHPSKSCMIVEARSDLGGTWDLFRYPGIRSDSDLYTFGYAFKPWLGEKAIADGPAILAYLRETATEHGIEKQICFHQKVVRADWQSAKAHWRVELERVDTGERITVCTRWLFSAAGYYRYDEGHTPHFEGVDHFKGTVIHPQHWPEELDYTGKQVVVIGSGATAITLVPTMADKARHVTLLQRTPSYVMSLPAKDPIANGLRKVLPDTWAYAITRQKNIALTRLIYRFCQTRPHTARRLIRYLNVKALPPGYPVDEHFNPPYNPWDQRLCAVPDGDLFKSICSGKASVVTDKIKAFNAHGVELASGKSLQADIIVTATGLNLQLFGGIRLSLDGMPVDLSRTVAFKGMMLSGLPNFAFAIGYTNASWTLKVGLLCEHFCRILSHMDSHGHAVCCPVVPSADMPTRPLLDFGAGYVQRALKDLPRQGLTAPWLLPMDYRVDAQVLRRGPVEDPGLKFSGMAPRPSIHARAAKAELAARA